MTLSTILLLAAIALAFFGSRRVAASAEALLNPNQAAGLWTRGRRVRLTRMGMLLGMVVLAYILPLGGLVVLPFYTAATHLYAGRLYAELDLPGEFRRRMLAADLLVAAGLAVAFVGIALPIGAAQPVRSG
jgi:hypothetical protein